MPVFHCRLWLWPAFHLTDWFWLKVSSPLSRHTLLAGSQCKSPVKLAHWSYSTWYKENLGWPCACYARVFYKKTASRPYSKTWERVFSTTTFSLLLCSLKCLLLKVLWKVPEMLVLNCESCLNICCFTPQARESPQDRLWTFSPVLLCNVLYFPCYSV